MDEVTNHDMKRVEEEKPMEEKSKSEGRESTAVAIQANVFDEEASFVERIQRISTHAEHRTQRKDYRHWTMITAQG